MRCQHFSIFPIFICFSSYLSVCLEYFWNSSCNKLVFHGQQKLFIDEKYIQKYEVCIIVCIFYILLFRNYGRMFSSDFILAVQKSFSYLRKVTTTAIGFTTRPILSSEHTSFTSSSTSSHLDLPPPSVSLTPHPVHPCSPSVTSRYSRRWCQQFANYCPPPPSHACGRDGMPPIVYTPYRTSRSDSLGRRQSVLSLLLTFFITTFQCQTKFRKDSNLFISWIKRSQALHLLAVVCQKRMRYTFVY